MCDNTSTCDILGFKAKNIALPIKSQKTVDEDNRFVKGLGTQIEIFGDVIAKMRENAPSNQKHMQDYLSAFCFGDFYSRGGLDLKTRELLTLFIISALGGAEGQVKACHRSYRSIYERTQIRSCY
jgi:4-carboxymuconolactone decarboxylase